MIRRRLSSKQREDLYKAEAEKAREAGRGEFPICNLCGMSVVTSREWDESHVGIPHAWGGTETGIAHRRCNRIHGARVVVPMVAKTIRQWRKSRDITRSDSPVPGGREDRLMRKINGKTVLRTTGEPWRPGR